MPKSKDQSRSFVREVSPSTGDPQNKKKKLNEVPIELMDSGDDSQFKQILPKVRVK